MRTATPRRHAAALVAAVLLTSSAVHAAVVCQKGKRVTVRSGPDCKQKEQKLADTAAFALGSDVQAADARLGVLETDVGTICPKAPGRKLAAKVGHNTPETLSAPYLRTDGCRALDGKPDECNNAFQSSLGNSSWYLQATSCFYHAGRCFPCAYELVRDGACVNACDPPVCANASDRTFVGGENACAFITEQAACEAAFVGGSEGDHEALTCFFNGTCRACGFDAQVGGLCTNGCSPLHTCSSRPGKPVPSCGGVAGGQGECEAAFQVITTNGEPYPASCFFDGTCKTCDLSAQFQQKVCTNACN